MSPRADFAPASELPIPEDAVIGKGFTEQMVEMAAHIGAYDTLRVVAAFGGEYLYIPEDPEKNRLRDVIGPEKAAVMSHVYGRERLHIPLARAALQVARRQPILAAVRANRLTVSDAARMLGSTQPYISHLVNHTEEGRSTPPATNLPRRTTRDPRQLTFLD